MSSRQGRSPIFTVFAGPNGAGKSTLTPQYQLGPKIDSDAIQRSLSPSSELLAAKETLRLLDLYKQQGRSFSWETTLSSNHAVNEIATAKAMGYDVRVYFVVLDSAQQSQDRVEIRVSQGGHAIPTGTIARRFEKIFEHAIMVAPAVDRFSLIDNHRGGFVRLLHIVANDIKLRAASESPRINTAINDIVQAVELTRKTGHDLDLDLDCEPEM